MNATNARVRLIEPPGHTCQVDKRAGKEKVTRYRRCLGPKPLWIGRNVLEKLRLYFAMKERVLYITSADATK